LFFISLSLVSDCRLAIAQAEEQTYSENREGVTQTGRGDAGGVQTSIFCVAAVSTLAIFASPFALDVLIPSCVQRYPSELSSHHEVCTPVRMKNCLISPCSPAFSSQVGLLVMKPNLL
jgi:hypothetical protein